MKLQERLIAFWFLISLATAHAQTNPIYENLPVGKYKVGFKIITLTDDTRVTMPEYNYMGEKNDGDRTRKITIHLWYPANVNSGKRKLTYGEYCYNHLLTSTNAILTEEQKTAQFNNRRTAINRWFGQPTDEAWKRLLETPLMAHSEASAIQDKFPLLIGMLRPLSTSITNELMASNGYVVAMLLQENFNVSSFPDMALSDIPSLQLVISRLMKTENINENAIGTFGFSGSGFVQVLLAMHDYRIKALADIESGIYMDGLYEPLAKSNYYNPSKLRVPFLHIFSRDLSKQEKFIADFEVKTKFSERYQLLLNQPGLHHWDFAAEGYTSCLLLNNRGEAQNNIQQSFELANTYLLNFFNAKLKADPAGVKFISSKPSLPNVQDDLWDIKVLGPLKPPPTVSEFESMIRKKGIQEAVSIVNSTLKNDSSSNLLQGFTLNNLGYTFLNEKKYQESIGVFKLNANLHPEAAGWIDSLAEAYEAVEDKENMKSISRQVLAILSKKETLTDGEKALKETAERRMKM
jgi:tetratricopeptide (TPR) repeat protein